MLTRLYIRNIGLIEKAELDFSGDLTVLTGETGAGKSMLIGALSLALGGRAEARLVGDGGKEAQVEATFEISRRHPLLEKLDDMAIAPEENEIILRRALQADGRSKAFVNGVRVTQAQLKILGEHLADIHSQYDNQLLLKPQQHAPLLDLFGDLQVLSDRIRVHYRQWKQAQKELEEIKARNASKIEEEELLRAYLEELEALSPEADEEGTLVTERQRLMAAEKLVDAFRTTLESLQGETDIVHALGAGQRALQVVAQDGGEEVSRLAERLSSLYEETQDAVAEVNDVARRCGPDPQRLEQVEERLFALRDCARKHHVDMAELIDLPQKFSAQLDELGQLQENATALEEQMKTKRKEFEKLCEKLTAERKECAKALAFEVEEALTHLKMAETRFCVDLQALPPEQWQEQGAEKIEFMVATNVGAALAPLVKVASGGEVSRLMLALKQVFYRNAPEMTLIFDEVDVGVGGAVADAVGGVLKEMARHHQVMAITHLPQVAARGQEHLMISKRAEKGQTVTSVDALGTRERQEEIARMLAGKKVTQAARQAAASLLGEA